MCRRCEAIGVKCRLITSHSLTPPLNSPSITGRSTAQIPGSIIFPSLQTGQSLESMSYKGNTKSFNINSFNKVVNTTIADDKAQVLQWLSSLEPQKRHQHLRESRLEGVGEWIFRTSEFQRWNAGDGSAHSVLFCHGDPGVGKTHLR